MIESIWGFLSVLNRLFGSFKNSLMLNKDTFQLPTIFISNLDGVKKSLLCLGTGED